MKYYLFAFILFPIMAQAEYRVYQYLVKSKNLTHQISTGDAQLELSTYDPQTYVRYHGGSSAVDITLQRTWLCEGYTGKKKAYCPHPSERDQL